MNEASRLDCVFDNIKASLQWRLKAMRCFGYHVIDKPLPPELLTFYVDEVVFRHKYVREQRRYKPRSYDGQVHYFRAAKNPYDLEEWRSITNRKLVVHEIPGTHLTMIEEAGAAELARSLKLCLEQAAAARQRLSSRAAGN
ncbi:MAG: hypothetical protein FJ143_01755 [Deltaproteobacteria bacterium]|nr:hypothetical protein [Deltaproteobacteria bacterium]